MAKCHSTGVFSDCADRDCDRWTEAVPLREDLPSAEDARDMRPVVRECVPSEIDLFGIVCDRDADEAVIDDVALDVMPGPIITMYFAASSPNNHPQRGPLKEVVAD